MKEKEKKKSDKQKRNKLLIGGFLSFLLAIISLGAGVYIGLMTLNYNYLTIGTFQSGNGIITMFVCSGLFIALGVVAVSVGIKLLAMKKCTNFVFYTKKGIILSSLVYYSIVTCVGLVAVFMCFGSIIPSMYMIVTIVLSVLAIILCVGCFILVFKEYKSFMNRIKNGEMKIQIEYPKRYIPAEETTKLAFNNKSYMSDSMGMEAFQHELHRLDEMRGQGLINDQEYQQLKKHYIDKMSNKLF